MVYKDLDSMKTEMRAFLKENPKSTYRDIREKLSIKIERLYKGGMEEAFKGAGIIPPRTFKRRSKDEKRKIIIDYIKRNPIVGGHTIRRETKIDFLTLFRSTKAAFDAAGIEYPRGIDKRKRQEKVRIIIDLIRKDPLITVNSIMNKTNANPYNLFKNLDEAYKQAGVKRISGPTKRTIKRKQRIIEFIKNNPLATQREINKACRTHIQETFEDGIFEAYKLAGIKFPYERLKLYGTTKKEIKRTAKAFEDKIAVKLSGYGKVNRLVKTESGFADIVFERKGKKTVIEIKDYKSKDVSISDVKQLNRYLEEFEFNLGILICHQKPKKDKFLIGSNKIFIIEESELNKIPQLVAGL